MKIIINQGGQGQAIVDVDKIEVYDLWRIAMHIEDQEDQRRVLEVWHLAHDLRGALQHIAAGANIKKPIATK